MLDYLSRLYGTVWSAVQKPKVAILGLGSAGKTSILYSLTGQMAWEEISQLTHTIGFNVEYIWHKGLKLTLWDISGNVHHHGIWLRYLSETRAIVFVVDSCDRDLLPEAASILQQTLDSTHVKNSPLLVFANKQDIPGALPVSEVSTALGLDKLEGRKWEIVGSSVRTGLGLQEGMDWLVGNI